MLESFFGSLVDGRTLHASTIHETHGSTDDPLSLEIAARAYKLIERVSVLGAQVANALHFGQKASRPLGCG